MYMRSSLDPDDLMPLTTFICAAIRAQTAQFPPPYRPSQLPSSPTATGDAYLRQQGHASPAVHFITALNLGSKARKSTFCFVWNTPRNVFSIFFMKLSNPLSW